jgi:hypothetical protein
VTALITANEFLEAQLRELQAAVSHGYARGKFEPVLRDRKDWYDSVGEPWPELHISWRCRSSPLTTALPLANPPNASIPRGGHPR